MRRELPISFLRECLEYSPDTGVLKWLERPIWHFNKASVWSRWNTRYSLRVVTSFNDGSYIKVVINNRGYRGHRIAWALFHGKWPDGDIDHVNGDRTDNRLQNLRDVSHLENSRNRAIPSNNTSGVMGVCWDREKCKWKAQIRFGDKTVNIGRYDDINEAIAAREAAARTFGFHPGHGRAQ